MSLNDDSYERQPGRTAETCGPLYEKEQMCFSGEIQATQLEHSIYILTARFTGLAYGYKHPVVWKRSAYRACRRRQRFCYMLMRDDFLLLSPKMPQVRTMHAWLCSDLGCVCNSQSSCVVVKVMAPLLATTQ